MLENRTNQELIDAWQAGHQQAAQVLVQRYMTRLTALARSRMAQQLAQRLDPDDIVMSAWRSFFVAVDRRQVGVPDDDNLWPLLVTLTLRKLARQANRHTADKRSIAAETGQGDDQWAAIVARDPTPAEAAMVADEIQSLMGMLDPADREILELRLQGHEHCEIAKATDCSERTVRRRLRRIRQQCVERREELGDLRPTNLDPAILELEFVGENEDAFKPELSAANKIAFADLLLQRMIGQGSFGKVYRAQHRSAGQTVAVKFLRRRLWQHRRATEQLIREGETIARLRYPGIAAGLGWGQTASGATFIVQDWVEGESLVTWFQQAHPSVQEVVACGLTTSRALMAAHNVGVVHGDVTPNNILRTSAADFVLTDFGFSHIAGQPIANTVGGTPGFLAPEQISSAFGRLGPATDVFGLGGVLYFLITGRAPARSGNVPAMLADTLSQSAFDSVNEYAPGTPALLPALIDRCLCKEAAGRPQTMAEVHSELRRIEESSVPRTEL